MKSRRDEVAALANVPIARVIPVSAAELRAAYADRAASVVVDVATQAPAFYWRVGETYYLDDAFFGEVVAIDDLAYDSEIGLHSRKWQ